VAFNYGTPGRTDIVVMGLDGSGRRVVAASNGKDLWGSPWWRAHGTVTVHRVLAGEDGIFEATGGGQPRLLTDGGGVVPMLPTWPRVDGRVAYAGKEAGVWRIWVLGDNGEARPISPAGIESYAPAWSPDGRRLAFQGGGAGIQTAASDSSDRRMLVPFESGIWTHAPAWSPDGRWIAYVGGRQDVHENFGDLYVVPATGGQPVRITNLGTVYDWRPAWVP
jgi:dipeptidyl aminopeptidase/acylaminoacyl peptidase